MDVSKYELTEEQTELFNKLTKLQKGVALHTIAGMKPADAHREAGGKCKTEVNRYKLANEILSNPSVKAFVDSIKKVDEEKAVSNSIMSRQEALERLTKIATTDVKDLVQADSEATVSQHHQTSNMNMTAIKQIADMMGYNREADPDTAVLTQEERILNMTKNHAVTDEKLN